VQGRLEILTDSCENTLVCERDALLDYLGFVERSGFEVTINDFSGLLVGDSGQSARFSSLFIHRNPFCMKIKSDARLWDECLQKKASLCRAAGERAGLFRGMCFCGREEFIMPVMKDGIVLATIGLGGFATDRARVIRRAGRALTGEGSAAALLDAAFASPAPSEGDAAAILGIAAAELLRCYETLEAARRTLVIPEAARLSREHRVALHAADYIRRNLAEVVDARQISAACHVSVSTLSHVFKKSMRLSLSAYRAKLRLESAKKLLLSGSGVTDAALNSGFDDPNYFSRVFVRSEGMPPGSWARKRLAAREPEASAARGASRPVSS
jgi:AraC-like DNA-binding protein